MTSKISDFAGWDIRLHQATADDLFQGDGWDDDTVDAAASVREYRKAILAAVKKTFPGAEVTEHAGPTRAYTPHDGPDDDQAYAIQLIGERVWESMAWVVDRVKTFVVVRHGANAANQSMTPKTVVAVVDAADAKQALDKAKAAGGFTLYANQFLEAVAEEDCTEEHLALWGHFSELQALAADQSSQT